MVSSAHGELSLFFSLVCVIIARHLWKVSHVWNTCCRSVATNARVRATVDGIDMLRMWWANKQSMNDDDASDHRYPLVETKSIHLYCLYPRSPLNWQANRSLQLVFACQARQACPPPPPMIRSTLAGGGRAKVSSLSSVEACSDPSLGLSPY
jgi:hypothetical protein